MANLLGMSYAELIETIVDAAAETPQRTTGHVDCALDLVTRSPNVETSQWKINDLHDVLW